MLRVIMTKRNSIQLHLGSEVTPITPVVAFRLALELIRAATISLSKKKGVTSRWMADYCKNLMVNVAIKFDNAIEDLSEDNKGYLLEYLTNDNLPEGGKHHCTLRDELEGVL